MVQFDHALRQKVLLALLLLSVAVAGCTSGDDNSNDASETTATSDQPETPSQELPAKPAMFDAGCPESGKSFARELTDDAPSMIGSRVVSGAGDLVLANETAAFAISAPVESIEAQKTWWSYGGIVVDAAAVSGCEQVSPDGVDEVGLVGGRLNVGSFTDSTLRAFRADTVEVINDGADGKAAVVRATGADDILYLIEYQLIREAAEDGGNRPLSEPLGIKMEVDYVLEPDSPVLSITTRVIAEQDGVEPLLGAALVTWSDQLESFHRPESQLDVGGFTIDLGIPWQVAHDDTGSFAFAVQDANQAVVPISGVQSFIDVNQALTSGMTVDNAGDEAEMTFLLSAGPTDGNSATRSLPAFDPELGPEATTSRTISGTVTDPAGDPIAARAELQMSRDGENWETYDVFETGDNGAIDGEIVVLPTGGTEPQLRLRLTAEGRAEVFADLGADGASYPMGPAGAIDLAITEADGHDLPSRVSMYQGDSLVAEFDTASPQEVKVAPGDYDVVVSRGFEYTRIEQPLTVPENDTVELTGSLERVVDTTDWITLDTHVHTAPSPDSTFDPGDRTVEAAAVGLEAYVNTNHEILVDLDDLNEAEGFVTQITGQEVTASSPEHTTMYPVEPDDTLRGGPPAWYGLDLGEIYAAEAERGASIRGLNHPSDYFDVIGFDVTTGKPTETDPSKLGLSADAELWSWDFEQIELQNGPKPVLRSDADNSGLFDEWQSGFNHGERVTAVGASDAHGVGVGESMTYIKVDTDDIGSVTPEMISDAVSSGRAVVTTGAFASIDIDGAGPGDTASVDAGSVAVSLKVQAAPGIDITELRIFANCDEVQTITVDASDEATRFDDTITLDLPADANITVLGFGEKDLPRPFDQFDATRVPRFTTNPVFVDVDGNGEFDAPGDKSCSYTK